MGNPVCIQVLMSSAEAERFDAYCREKAHKKSPLIARLVREHLDREGFRTWQAGMVRDRRKLRGA